MKNIKEIEIGITHRGNFHADDVFATALLEWLNPMIRIQRVLKVDEVQDPGKTIVYDIGGGEYDHHAEKKYRPVEDGTYEQDGEIRPYQYSSFGLLWRDYGRLCCEDELAWKSIDRALVLPIDKCDNGIQADTLSSAVGEFNSTYEECDEDLAFNEAVEVAKAILRRYIRRANSKSRARVDVLNGRRMGPLLILDEFRPWEEYVVNEMPDVLFVIFPSNRGGYAVRTVPNAPGSFTGRKGFPEEWLGKQNKELGITFCHRNNFVLNTETEEQAINVAMIAALNFDF